MNRQNLTLAGIILLVAGVALVFTAMGSASAVVSGSHIDSLNTAKETFENAVGAAGIIGIAGIVAAVLGLLALAASRSVK